MNCYDHPHENAVATCPDCGKGLCYECAHRFASPICPSCRDAGLRNEKKAVQRELLMPFLIGTIMLILFCNFVESPSVIFRPQNMTQSIFGYLVIGYILCGIVAGWQTLTRITPAVFLVLPLIGWLIYFVVKLFLSFYVGLVMLPVRTIRNASRLRMLNRLS